MKPIGPLDPTACGCDDPARLSGLISYQEAMRRVLTLPLPEPEIETLELRLAAGRLLAQAVVTATPLPPFDNAAMDGYAIRRADLTGDGPWLLPVIGRAAAGAGDASKLGKGEAVRIFTGAALPNGADAVVMQEDVKVSGKTVVLRDKPREGENIRRAGSELPRGIPVLQSGTRLGPRQIATAAAAGAGKVSTYHRRRVAILITGNELRQAGSDLQPGQINDTNGPMLVAELSRDEISATELIQVGDRPGDFVDALGRAAGNVDLILTTGGASVGDEDHLAAALEYLGARVIFRGVAIKPGKPITIAQMGNVPVLGLPGNPVAAFIGWRLFGLPLLNRLCGTRDAVPGRRIVIAGRDLSHPLGRCEFRPARLCGLDASGRDVVDAGEATHSAMLSVLERADGLILLPADIDHVRQGDLLEFLPL